MIFQVFVLRCDDCGKASTDNPYDFSLSSHSDARAEARIAGWGRRIEGMGEDRKDYCPQCKGSHQ